MLNITSNYCIWTALWYWNVKLQSVMNLVNELILKLQLISYYCVECDIILLIYGFTLICHCVMYTSDTLMITDRIKDNVNNVVINDKNFLFYSVHLNYLTTLTQSVVKYNIQHYIKI